MRPAERLWRAELLQRPADDARKRRQGRGPVDRMVSGVRPSGRASPCRDWPRRMAPRRPFPNGAIGLYVSVAAVGRWIWWLVEPSDDNVNFVGALDVDGSPFVPSNQLSEIPLEPWCCGRGLEHPGSRRSRAVTGSSSRRRQPQLYNLIVLWFVRLRPVRSDLRYHSAAATEVMAHQIAAQSPRDVSTIIRADTRSGRRSGSPVGLSRRGSPRGCVRWSQNTVLVFICFFHPRWHNSGTLTINSSANRLKNRQKCVIIGRQVEPNPAEMADRYVADMTVPGWCKRLIRFGRGNRQVDRVVSGTERRLGFPVCTRS